MLSILLTVMNVSTLIFPPSVCSPASEFLYSLITVSLPRALQSLSASHVRTWCLRQLQMPSVKLLQVLHALACTHLTDMYMALAMSCLIWSWSGNRVISHMVFAFCF